MPAKYKTYWYSESAFVKNAFLYDCREEDLTRSPGKRLEQGEIVLGCVGVVAAEQTVPGFAAKIVPFMVSRSCEWQGLTLRCMAHPSAPNRKLTPAELRQFNYIVAELPDERSVALAVKFKLPVIQTADARNLVNLEISQFERQGRGSQRRARLL